MEVEELLPYWLFHENKKTPFKQRKVTFKQKGRKLLSDIFVEELSKGFNWHNIDNLSK